MSKLRGKVAVVTGASKGIGAGVAKALAAEGAAVVVNYASSQAGAMAVVDAITAGGGRTIAVKGDVSKSAEAGAIIDAAITAFGRLDILVNNAGIYEWAALGDITISPDVRHQRPGPVARHSGGVGGERRESA
jgi:3-oxoacyl-[acyl-carrier protein] reductase